MPYSTFVVYITLRNCIQISGEDREIIAKIALGEHISPEFYTALSSYPRTSNLVLQNTIQSQPRDNSGSNSQLLTIEGKRDFFKTE